MYQIIVTERVIEVIRVMEPGKEVSVKYLKERWINVSLEELLKDFESTIKNTIME